MFLHRFLVSVVLLFLVPAGMSQETKPSSAIPDQKPAAIPASRIRVDPDVQSGKLVNHVQPIYPPLAHQARISGTVKFHAIIAKDGSVQELQMLSGHPLLVQSALDAVRQWRYQPMLLNGEPVEAETEIVVNFNLLTGTSGTPHNEPTPTPQPSIPDLGEGTHVEENPQGDTLTLLGASNLTPAAFSALLEKAKAGNKQVAPTLALAYYSGFGVKPNFVEAAKWARTGAEQGSAVAQELLGKLYLLGHGVTKDNAEALKWIRKAAEKGFSEGQYDLGVMYYQGQGVPVNYPEAHKMFTKAAEQWHRIAQLNLCVMHYKGLGVPRDLVVASMWCILAAGPGNEPGRKYLEELKKEMKSDQVAEGERRALQWAKDRLGPQTNQVTATIVSIAPTCLSFVVSQEIGGKKRETTFATNLDDGIGLRGAQGCTIIPPSGRAYVLKIGSKASIYYLAREHDNLAVSVTLAEP